MNPILIFLLITLAICYMLIKIFPKWLDIVSGRHEAEIKTQFPPGVSQEFIEAVKLYSEIKHDFYSGVFSKNPEGLRAKSSSIIYKMKSYLPYVHKSESEIILKMIADMRGRFFLTK
jgi:hypothetical protein